MYRKITRDELAGLMRSKRDLKIVDVLDKSRYDKEHIKGAISLPLEEIELDAGRILKKDDLIVVYCASFECQASTAAAEKLLSLGYKNVLEYKGGIKDYKEANLHLEGSAYSRRSSVLKVSR